ncbi:MAG TPA: glycosyltransferase family 39 protein [Flavobacteriales bacterium]|nr:glycosyltransferase family 39 protein [Flavobacteriales bacterium]
MEIQKNKNGIINRFKPIHLVLVVAFLVRIPYVFFTSYTHDELSALVRLDFNSIGELISKGVLIDYHPPLVQIFLFYYTKIFGQAEWVVKMPFALCGLASVWVIYKTGKKYINEYAGVLTAGVLAVTQLYIYHSNVARPYAPALLFTLLFLHCFLKLVVDDDKKIKTKILYVLFACCAGATHYFAGLTVGVLGICGIILLKRHQIVSYFSTNAIIVVLFIPLYFIMQNQLTHGGLGGWLGAPEKGYAFKFILYLFHYDRLFLGFFLAALVLAFIQLFRKRELTRVSLHIVLTCSFVIVYATAILYSKYKTPIMQFSILQFGLPFLLLSVFSIFHALPKKPLNWFTPLFLLFGLYSLFFTRLNHDMMMDYPYKAFAEFCEPIKRDNPDKKILVVTSDRPEFIERYLKGNKNFKIFSIYNIEKPYEMVWNEVQAYNPDKIISGNCDFNTYGLLRSQYRYYERKKEGFLNNFFLFSKTTKNMCYQEIPDAPNVWLHKNERIIMDSANQFCNLADTLFMKLNLYGSYQLKFEAEIKSTDHNPLVLVLEFHENDQRTFWYGGELFTNPSANEFNYTYTSFDMSHELKKHDIENLRIKFYLWNAKSGKVQIQRSTLSFHEPNKKLYGLTEDFNR